MSRVAAADVILLLHQEADRTGNNTLRIKASTLRKWVQRGHITGGRRGYDLAEIVAYVDSRTRDTTNG